jgi:hypothetical protein
MSRHAQPHPAYFEVLFTRRAYTSALYLLTCLLTGIAAFTFTVTGLSLSLGLAILILGIPFFLGFLTLARILSGLELRWLRATVDEDLAEPPPFLPPGETFRSRLGALLKDGRTWTSLLYFVLLLPLGLTYFATLTTLLASSLGFLAAPLLRGLATASCTTDLPLDDLAWFAAHPTQAMLMCALLGMLLLPATLHLALLLGRLQAWLAGRLLVRA